MARGPGSDRALVAVYVGLAALPTFAMIVGWQGRELHGSVTPAPRPSISASAILSETFQAELGRWFEARLGLKGTSIALDNALLYFGFHETKPGAGVRLGEDGVLFNDDLDYYNKHGRWLTDPAYVERMADEIADVQRRFRTTGRAFVPMIIPSKTSIWRDKISPRWLMDLPSPRPADETTRMVRSALDRRGVVYVDVPRLFAASPVDRSELFGPDARHWSAFGACLAMREGVRAAASLTSTTPLAYDCALEHKRVTRSNDDYDLWRLLNAAWVYPKVKAVPVARHAVPPPASAPRPSVLFVGSSFCWQIMRDAKDSGLFRSARLNFYNKTFEDSVDADPIPVEPGTERWRRLTLDNELVVLDLFESYLGFPDAYVGLFLHDVLAELDARPLTAAP